MTQFISPSSVDLEDPEVANATQPLTPPSPPRSFPSFLARLAVLLLILLGLALLMREAALWFYGFVESQANRRVYGMLSSALTAGLALHVARHLAGEPVGAIWRALRQPGWRPFLLALLGLRRHAASLLVLAFATTFSIKQMGEEITGPESENGSGIRSQLTKAMSDHGYTRTRAVLLDRLVERCPQPDGPATPNCPAGENYARFPVVFPRAQVDPDSDPEIRFERGTDYEAARNHNLIEELVRALTPCGAPDGSSPVRLRVEGYASSEHFFGLGPSESERQNLRVADERRRAVQFAIEEQIARLGARERIVVTGTDHIDFFEMVRARRFNDRPEELEAGQTHQDLFTRSAHIVVMDPGTCATE